MKRTYWCGVTVIVAAWWWHRASPTPTDDPHRASQVAVTGDGFALLHELEGDWRRVRELSRDGEPVADHLIQHDGEVRLVGTRAGATLAWIDGRNVRLGSPDGREQGRWGKSVHRLCDGAATNASQFGVGWLESDRSVWMVHGPTSASLASDELAIELATEPATWCGIASAEQNIALMWRDRDRLKINLCSKTRCSTTVTSTPLDRRTALLGFGCLRDTCAIATRDRDGNTRLAYVVGSGAQKWSTPIDTDAATVSIAGIGDRAFAVGYRGARGSEVIRLDRKGERVVLWQGPKTTPVVNWASGTLLIAYDDGGKLAHAVLDVANR